MGQVAPKQAESPELESVDAALEAVMEPKLINLMQQSEALVSLMREFFQQLDKRRAGEFAVIAGYIAKAKEEIRELRPHDLSQERIPTAGAELEAITRDTENATHNIMNAAEAIMGMDASDPKAYKAAVDDEVMKIFEACSFQDITGQRVSKVVNVLKQIEERVGKLAATLGVEDKDVELTEREKRARDLLLNGPAIGGPETRQDAIDAMFDEGFAAPELKPQAPRVETPKPEAPKVEAKVAAPKAEPKPEPKPAPAPAAKAAPAPAPAPVSEPQSQPQSQDDIDALFDTPSNEPQSQDDIDALFDMSPEDMNKTNSQDDIDALFD
ncbi:protein phosphatase CheZ [Asticcacaulis sp. AND118]|uniref:protein phosphatase CheZ n=1 Tax=Asticcacaulis sp. AND118 TaxID=2840468 RepID=UPI001D00141F|nr:protein phosphatase CheZ [Asticcacaulis sp. AND118]UDF04502.1 protein phosphatase CheZ [Asticcacaulis sp. AND118]